MASGLRGAPLPLELPLTTLGFLLFALGLGLTAALYPFSSVGKLACYPPSLRSGCTAQYFL